jgi:hypothetical protein
MGRVEVFVVGRTPSPFGVNVATVSTGEYVMTADRVTGQVAPGRHVDHAASSASSRARGCELDEINEKAAELRAALRDQDAVARELAETEARLARMNARRVPLLDDVRVVSPSATRAGTP